MDTLTFATQRFYGAGEVAEMLGVSERTVRNWLSTGELKSYKFGGSRRILDDDMWQFVARGCAEEEEGA